MAVYVCPNCEAEERGKCKDFHQITSFLDDKWDDRIFLSENDLIIECSSYQNKKRKSKRKVAKSY